jgi:hypothetical protein
MAGIDIDPKTANSAAAMLEILLGICVLPETIDPGCDPQRTSDGGIIEPPGHCRNKRVPHHCAPFLFCDRSKRESEISSKGSIRMRACHVLLVMGLVQLFAASALAQVADPVAYANPEYGFRAIFPDEPMMREVAYTKRDGSQAAAHQFYVERGINEYVVTVVDLPDGPAIDFDEFDHAVARTRAAGEVRAESEVAYDPGIPGWQISVFQPDGRQRRASIYFYANRLFFSEAITEPGDLEGMRMEQSLYLLEPDGSQVNTGAGNAAGTRP